MNAAQRPDRVALVLAGTFGLAALVGTLWMLTANRSALHEIPRRLAHGRPLRLEHWMALGFRWAAIASVVMGVIGAATVRWWGRGVAGGSGWPAGAHPPWTWERRRWFFGALVLCTVIAGGLRFPRLTHSFWNDEAYAARAYVWGVKELRPDGTLEFKPVSWKTALFLNRKGNNHLCCSIEARLSLGLWQRLTGRGRDEFNEAAMRAPAFVWGLLTVPALGLLGGLVFGARGWLAALLLAVHPWHVRFAAEMRGYAAMLLALVLGLLFLAIALRDGGWRWWLLAAATNLWALLAFAGCAYVPLVANAAALGWLVWKKQHTLAGRLLVANALAAIPFLWLYGPSIPQLATYLGSGAAHSSYQIDAAWLRALWTCLCLGADWSIMSPVWRDSVALPVPAGQAAALAGASLLFAVQAIRWVRSRRVEAAVPAVFLLAGVIGIAQNMMTRSPVLIWYFLPMLLGWVFTVMGPPGRASGGPASGGPAGGGTRWRTVGAAAVAIAGVSCLFGNSLGFLRLEHHPMRAAAAVADTQPVRPVTADAGVSDRQMLLYDPGITVVRTAADLERVEGAAAAAGRPLIVYVCGIQETYLREPDVWLRLRSTGYEVIAELPGWEPMFSYRVLRKAPRP